MRIDLSRLECRSAFDGPGERLFDAGTATRYPGTRIVEVPDVLFLPDVLEPGQSLCLLDETAVCRESVLDCWAVDFFKEQWPSVADRSPYAAEFCVAPRVERVCILGNLFSRNFGHWTEELLKVVVLEAFGFDGWYVVPSLPRFAFEFLQIIGVRDRVLIVDEPTVFARAVFSTAIDHTSISRFRPVLFALRERLSRHAGAGSSQYGPRLWLDRQAQLHNSGGILNMADVRAVLAPYGFCIVDPAVLSVREQLQLVRAASVIAGPHGSQFVLSQFMPEHSTVIECFSPQYVNPSVLDICRALGHSYHQVVSRTHTLTPYRFGRDCQVDCDHLRLVLESL